MAAAELVRAVGGDDEDRRARAAAPRAPRAARASRRRTTAGRRAARAPARASPSAQRIGLEHRRAIARRRPAGRARAAASRGARAAARTRRARPGRCAAASAAPRRPARRRRRRAAAPPRAAAARPGSAASARWVLPTPGLTGEQHQRAAAGERLAGRIREPRRLALAADQRRVRHGAILCGRGIRALGGDGVRADDDGVGDERDLVGGHAGALGLLAHLLRRSCPRRGRRCRACRTPPGPRRCGSSGRRRTSPRRLRRNGRRSAAAPRACPRSRGGGWRRGSWARSYGPPPRRTSAAMPYFASRLCRSCGGVARAAPVDGARRQPGAARVVVEEQAADQLAGRVQARAAGGRPASSTRASASTRTPPNVNVIPHVTGNAVNGGVSIGSAQLDFGTASPSVRSAVLDRRVELARDDRGVELAHGALEALGVDPQCLGELGQRVRRRPASRPAPRSRSSAAADRAARRRPGTRRRRAA